jgi:hypothetical protein
MEWKEAAQRRFKLTQFERAITMRSVYDDSIFHFAFLALFLRFFSALLLSAVSLFSPTFTYRYPVSVTVLCLETAVTN